MSVYDQEQAPGVARLLASAAGSGIARRRDIALIDLFLAVEERPSDLQRATMLRLLDGLIREIEARLASALDERIAPERPVAAAVLERAGLLRDPALVAQLLRRADAHRLAIGLRAAQLREGSEAQLLATLSHHDDSAVATAAAAFAGDYRGIPDRFLAPTLGLGELPASLARSLLWSVAAAMRMHLRTAGDAALDAASAAMLARATGEDSHAEDAAQLAAALARAGALDDRLIVRALAEGQIALAVAALAERARIAPDIAWDMLFDGDRLIVLLRAIGMARTAAAEIALTIADARGEQARLVEQFDDFDALDPAHADAALAPWRLAPEFRAAIAALDAGLAR